MIRSEDIDINKIEVEETFEFPLYASKIALVANVAAKGIIPPVNSFA